MRAFLQLLPLVGHPEKAEVSSVAKVHRRAKKRVTVAKLGKLRERANRAVALREWAAEELASRQKAAGKAARKARQEKWQPPVFIPPFDPVKEVPTPSFVYKVPRPPGRHAAKRVRRLQRRRE